MLSPLENSRVVVTSKISPFNPANSPHCVDHLDRDHRDHHIMAITIVISSTSIAIVTVP